MRSERKQGVLGLEYIQFYDDDGNRIGTAEPYKNMFGDTIYRYYDNDRNIIGEGREEIDFWGNYKTVHRDSQGNITSTSERTKDFFGNDQVIHKDNDGNVIGVSEKRTDSWGNEYTHTEIKEKRLPVNSSIGSPVELSDIALFILVILVILIAVGTYYFMHTMYDSGIPMQMTAIFEMLSKWCLIGVIIGGIIFYVSRKASASKLTSLTEAILGGVLYQTLYWNFLNDSTGNYSGPYFGLIPIDAFHGFSALLLPFVLLSPMVICTICLAVGSSGNRRLRDSYIKMNNWLYNINSVIICLWFGLLLTGGEKGVWNGFFIMIIVYLWLFFGAYMCKKINKMILKETEDYPNYGNQISEQTLITEPEFKKSTGPRNEVAEGQSISQVSEIKLEQETTKKQPNKKMLFITSSCVIAALVFVLGRSLFSAPANSDISFKTPTSSTPTPTPTPTPPGNTEVLTTQESDKIDLTEYLDDLYSLHDLLGGKQGIIEGYPVGECYLSEKFGSYGSAEHSSTVDIVNLEQAGYELFGIYVGQNIDEAVDLLTESGWVINFAENIIVSLDKDGCTVYLRFDDDFKVSNINFIRNYALYG